MRKIVSLFLSLLMLLSVFTMPGAALAEEREHIIKYSISDDPQQMDPTLNSFARSSLVLQNLFQGLYKLAPDGSSYIGACAEDYDISADGMTYTFYLREDLKWSDGSDLTADDFVYSWKRVLTPEVASGCASDLWVIKNGQAYNTGNCSADEVGVYAPDPHTLVVETEYYAPWFLTLTATVSFFPVKQEVVEAEEPWTKSVDTYVSNGVFMLQEYSSLDKLVMVKNPYYYDYDKVEVEQVIYYIIADTNSVLVAYNNDELNVAADIDINALQQYGGTAEYTSSAKAGIQYWDFNTQLPEFSDKRVRQAFAYSVDRQALLNACQLVNEQPVFGFVPDLQPSLTTEGNFRSVSGAQFSEDLAKAQALMEEAGYPGGANFPVVEIVCQNSDEQKLMAQIIGEMWKSNLGIEYTITTYDSATYWDELANGNFSVGRNGYTCDYVDPSANLKIWVTGSNASENGWDDPVYDQMIADANLLVDSAEREAALIAAEAYLCDQMPGMPMYSYNDPYLAKPYISGIVRNSIGHIFFEYATFAD